MATVEKVVGKVANVITDTEVAFNIGSHLGIKPGDIATVMRTTQIRDPDTGDVLGLVQTPHVRFRIHHVNERFSLGLSYESVSKEPGEGVSTILGPRSIKRITQHVEDIDWATVLVRPGDIVEISRRAAVTEQGGEEKEEEPPPEE